MNWQDLPETYNWLMQFVNYEKNTDEVKFTLDNIRILTEYFGHPEYSHRKIHVAGSKGKGSTSCFIAHLLQEAGYKVGIYSSPHVQYFSERFVMPDGPFSPEIYQDAATELKTGVTKLITEHKLDPQAVTWYDLVVIYGMLIFRRAKVDFVVYEVGMGGRLDSTNVIMPEVSVITPIELEHTAVLGKTHAKIAREKAGIIKPGIPVVSAHQVPSAKRVIAETAQANQSKLIYLPDVCRISQVKYAIISQNLQMSYHLQLFNREYQLSSQLVGNAQAENAALAILATKQVTQITDKAIVAAIAAAKLPGRFEFIRGEQIGYPDIPYLIIDGAHTKASIATSIKILTQVPKAQEAVVLFGTPKGKNITAMTAEVAKFYHDVTVTRPGDFEVSDPDVVAAAFRAQGMKAAVVPDFKQAITETLQHASQSKRPAVFLGSLHLAGEVKKILTKSCS